MWEQIIETAANSGIWTMLFVVLFGIQIKDSKAREGKYQELINSLSDKLSVVIEIKDTLEEVRDNLSKKL